MSEDNGLNTHGNTLSSLLDACRAMDPPEAPEPAPAPVPAPLQVPRPPPRPRRRFTGHQPTPAVIYRVVNQVALSFAGHHLRHQPNILAPWPEFTIGQLNAHPDILQAYTSLTSGGDLPGFIGYSGTPALSLNAFSRLVALYYRDIYHSIRRLIDIFLNGYCDQYPRGPSLDRKPHFF